MAAQSEATVRVKILDVEYSVTSGDDENYLQKVAEMVDRRMRLLEQSEKGIPPLKCAILTAMNLADELSRTRRQLEQYQAEAADFSREIAMRSRRLVERCRRIQV